MAPNKISSHQQKPNTRMKMVGFSNLWVCTFRIFKNLLVQVFSKIKPNYNTKPLYKITYLQGGHVSQD